MTDSMGPCIIKLTKLTKICYSTSCRNIVNIRGLNCLNDLNAHYILWFNCALPKAEADWLIFDNSMTGQKEKLDVIYRTVRLMEWKLNRSVWFKNEEIIGKNWWLFSSIEFFYMTAWLLKYTIYNNISKWKLLINRTAYTDKFYY